MAARFESSEMDCIKEVWKTDLETAFEEIQRIVKDYPFVAMDTEFPGEVCYPVGRYSEYQKIKGNVDITKVIQVGLSFFDEDGNSPSPSTFQFNFNFNLGVDMCAKKSIEFLQGCGIQFCRHKEEGVDVARFTELLWGSGLVLRPEVNWITFQGAVDFAYLVKMLTGSPLPSDEVDFRASLRLFFPNLYDIKYIVNSGLTNLKGGLQAMANQINIQRKGQQHQAGSDSLLTGSVFFKIKQFYFQNKVDSMLNGEVGGLTYTPRPANRPINSVNRYRPMPRTPFRHPRSALI